MAVLNFHHPWALTFGLLGNLISFTVYVAPVPTFLRIYKKKSTEGFQSLPYIVALFSSMLWLYYAIIKKDALLLTTINSFGCVIETIYIIIYIIYAPKEKKVSTMKLLIFLIVGLLSFIAFVTQFLVKESIRVQVLGWVCVAISVTVFAAPLFVVAQVIRTKSVEFMPFALSLFLTLSAVMWFAYGLFTSDLCVALPNVLGFILGLLQMVLYAVYQNTEKAITDEKKLQDHNLRSIVILSPLRAAEVYPMEIQPMQNEEAAELENPKPEPQKNEKSMEDLDVPHPNKCAV